MCTRHDCDCEEICKPHPHAALIKQWADNPNLVFQCRPKPAGKFIAVWTTILRVDVMTWSTSCDYRIKPEPKPDIVKYVAATPTYGHSSEHAALASVEELPEKYTGVYKTTFDGETGKLKSVELI